MKKIFCISIFLLFSCKTTPQKSAVLPKQNKEDIQFNFSNKDLGNNQFLIEASLYNLRQDTVYFLSSTCEGDQYLIVAKNQKIQFLPKMSCNSSFPTINKIAPQSYYKFQTTIALSDKRNSLTLGFDFREVSKNFDLKKNDTSKINRKIIWGSSKKL